MAKDQMMEHMKNNAGAATPRERRTALTNAVAWGDDWITRLEARKTQKVGEFRRRKASWQRHVGENEVPHAIPAQTNQAKNCRLAGGLAITVEVGLATVALLAFALLFVTSLIVATTISLIAAVIVTLALAYIFHAVIISLIASDEENPPMGIRRLNRYAILPTTLLMLVSVVAWVALQRLDAVTVLALSGIISFAKLTAMLGFVGLGAALWAKASLLDWSRTRAGEYEQICDEIQATKAKAIEWKETLKDLEEPSQIPPPIQKDSEEQGQLALPAVQTSPQQPQTPPATIISNGTAASIKGTAPTAALTLLAMLVGLGVSGCVTGPQIKRNMVTGLISVKVVVDASGVKNSDALKKSGENLRQQAPSILAQLAMDEPRLAKDLSVYWFGANGWNAEEKRQIPLPQYPKPELIPTAPNELCKVKPDVCEVEKQQQKAALEAAQAQARADYQSEVQKALVPLTATMLVPPPDTNSPCTDINGVFGRFVKNAASPQLLILLTDGRQNARQTYAISQVAFPPNKVAVVVMLVPGTENDGQGDFESRSKVFLTACPWAVVVPYHHEGLDKAVAEALQKADEYAAQKQ